MDALLKASQSEKDALNRLIQEMENTRAIRITQLESENQTLRLNSESEDRLSRIKMAELESLVELGRKDMEGILKQLTNERAATATCKDQIQGLERENCQLAKVCSTYKDQIMAGITKYWENQTPTLPGATPTLPPPRPTEGRGEGLRPVSNVGTSETLFCRQTSPNFFT